MTAPLAGYRVVVTRASHQAPGLMARLQARGAVPLAYPCIAIVPPADTTPLDRALLSAAEFDWLVLTSANAVFSLRLRLDALGLRLPCLRMATVGRSTARAARAALGLAADCIAEEGLADGLAPGLSPRRGERILLPQGDLADHSLAEALEQRGGAVTRVDAYRTIRGSGGVTLPAMLRAGSVDAVTLTSASTALHLVGRLRLEGGSVHDLAHVPVVCIGPSTAASARRLALQHLTTAPTHTVDGLIGALEHALYGKPTRGI